MNLVKSLSLFVTLFFTSLGHTVLKDQPVDKIIDQYNSIHKKFFKQNCKPGEEAKYYQLLRDYRGSGFFLPTIDDNVDLDAIKENLALMVDKKHWIENQIKYVSEIKNWPKIKEISKSLQESLSKLLLYKKKYYLSISQQEKSQAKSNSQQELIKLAKNFQTFLTHIPFLLSFSHPVDHLQNRKDYDEVKDRLDIEGQKISNSIYMKRKVYEDGALNADHTGPDTFLRSTIDTLSLHIPKQVDFLSEEVRYDVEWVIRRVDSELLRGKSKILERLNAWLTRTVNTIVHYRSFLRIEDEKMLEENRRLALKKKNATLKLNEYVYAKQKDTYLFWLNQPEKMRSLFVLETILFNEVGRVDGKLGLERIDVAKIVKNRTQDEAYNKLPDSEQLTKLLLEQISRESISQQVWLNVLFKKGEFSFTYPYISGVVKIFCPDMTGIGKKLRRENLKIAHTTLIKPDKQYNALRYFSRASMNGRIDMSTVWQDYELMAEQAGPEVELQSKLRAHYLADNYRYLYSFIDQDKRQFQVLEIDDQAYVMSYQNKKPVFYIYRNPHYFKYFERKSKD